MMNLMKYVKLKNKKNEIIETKTIHIIITRKKYTDKLDINHEMD